MYRALLTCTLVVLCACNNAPSDSKSVASNVLRADDEPAGENCAAGGVAIHSGLDTDKSGTLSDSEITSSKHVCNGVTPEAAPSIAALEDAKRVAEARLAEARLAAAQLEVQRETSASREAPGEEARREEARRLAKERHEAEVQLRALRETSAPNGDTKSEKEAAAQRRSSAVKVYDDINRDLDVLDRLQGPSVSLRYRRIFKAFNRTRLLTDTAYADQNKKKMRTLQMQIKKRKQST